MKCLFPPMPNTVMCCELTTCRWKEVKNTRRMVCLKNQEQTLLILTRLRTDKKIAGENTVWISDRVELQL